MLAAVDWDSYWLYVATEAALSLSPGPAVLLVIAYALSRGARLALSAALGILTANVLYFALSAAGVGAALAAAPLVFTLLRWAGACYLVFIGIGALLGRPSPLTLSTANARAPRPAAIFAHGFALQLANPKTLIFFVAILPQFVDPRLPAGAQMLWLAAGSVVPEFFILAGYALLAARAGRLATDARFARRIERVAGALLLVVAALVLAAPDPVPA